jgi:glyoxylase-like metal-dependent hydrolase (beta-lactamase superfamily II)
LKIADNVYVVPQVNCNPYLIVDPDGVTLIDAGLPRTDRKILAYLSGLGKTPRDLKHIIITHADYDHIAGLPALHKASGAQTYASRIEADAIAAGKPSRVARIPKSVPPLRRLMRFLLRPKPFKVDEILTDGQVLPILGGLRVIDTAGHTPGHISLFAPAVGILFCGDSLVVDKDGSIRVSRPELTWDAARAKESARRQAALGARIVCSGHGPVAFDAASKFPVL